MEYHSNNNTHSDGSAVVHAASGSKNRKPATAQQLIRENVKFLIEQLEAGHSESLTAFLDAMAHFHSYSFGNVLLNSETKARRHQSCRDVYLEPAWPAREARRKGHRHPCPDDRQSPQEAECRHRTRRRGKQIGLSDTMPENSCLAQLLGR